MLDFVWKIAHKNRAYEIRSLLTNTLYDIIEYVDTTIRTTSYFKCVFTLLWNMSWKNFLIFITWFSWLFQSCLAQVLKMISNVIWLLLRLFGELLVGKTRCKRISFDNQMNSGVATHILKWSFMIWETFQTVLATKIKGERKLDIWLTRLRKQWCTFRCASLWLIST